MAIFNDVEIYFPISSSPTYDLYLPYFFLPSIDLPKREIFQFTLTDLLGKVVLQEDNVSRKYIFETKDFSRGTYLIKLENGKEKYSRKLLIE